MINVKDKKKSEIQWPGEIQTLGDRHSLLCYSAQNSGEFLLWIWKQCLTIVFEKWFCARFVFNFENPWEKKLGRYVKKIYNTSFRFFNVRIENLIKKIWLGCKKNFFFTSLDYTIFYSLFNNFTYLSFL